jgi:predicted MPP superfamily phosphohydrolase
MAEAVPRARRPRSASKARKPREPRNLRTRRRAWAWPGSWPHLSVLIARALAMVSLTIYRGEIRHAISDWLARHRKTTRPEFRLARGGADLDGLRIAFLSDIHAGNYLDENDFLDLCGRLASEAPDLVCLGGDLVNLYEHEILHLQKGLSLLQPPLGTFAIFGNHEYEASRNPALWRSVLEASGVEVLLNRGRRITRGDASFWLAGVDDLLLGQPDLEAALAGRKSGEPIVLLSHHPDFFEEAADVGVDLQLSGHTHGGQILFFGRTPLRHTHEGYWAGRFERDGAQLYVGRGVGVSFIPVRIGAPAEVAIVTLRVG